MATREPIDAATRQSLGHTPYQSGRWIKDKKNGAVHIYLLFTISEHYFFVNAIPHPTHFIKTVVKH